MLGLKDTRVRSIKIPPTTTAMAHTLNRTAEMGSTEAMAARGTAARNGPASLSKQAKLAALMRKYLHRLKRMLCTIFK
jgi:hypothetical protein